MIELSPEKQKELDEHLVAVSCILYEHTSELVVVIDLFIVFYKNN
jgi:hypothetical protein